MLTPVSLSIEQTICLHDKFEKEVEEEGRRRIGWRGGGGGEEGGGR